MDKSVLLIFPPFAAGRSPYASIPVLAGYLRTRGIKVKSLDANIEFFHRFLTPERIRRAQEIVQDRLLELNGREKLASPAEETEYLTLAGTIYHNRKIWEELPQAFEGVREARKLRAFYAALNIASLSHYPQTLTIVPQTGNLKYDSWCNPYSTNSILASLDREGMLSGFFEDLLYPLLERELPTVVGISVPFSLQIEGALLCARAIKQRFPRVHVALGGSYISGTLRSLNNPGFFDLVDSMVIDDGEVPLENLINELAEPRPRLDRIPGLVYREEGQIRRNPPATPLPLESLPPPDYTTFDLDRYLLPREEQYLPLRTCRGCFWGRCAFCRTDLPVICHHQHPPADYLYETIREVVRATGVRKIAYVDEASDPKVLDELSHRFLRENLSINWATNVRFHPDLSEERFSLYREAGATDINMGLETYNNRLLQLARKGIKTEWVGKVLSNMVWTGLNIMVYMIVGFPTETEEEALRSFAAVAQFRKMGLLSSFKYNMLQILSHSPMYNDPARFGISRLIIPPSYDLDGPIMDFESTGMSRNQAYRFSCLFNGEMPPSFSEVPIGGREVKLKFDPAQIYEKRLARMYVH